MVTEDFIGKCSAIDAMALIILISCVLCTC